VLPETDVAIVGSGPNALSLAAHLRARQVEYRIFGPPMKFWRDMPRGINLKSFAYATNVYVPAKGNTFPEWCRARGLEDFEPCTMASYAAYGMWMKDHFVPDLDPRVVTRVSVDGGGRFEVTLANEERLRARRVVFATGLSYLSVMPEPLRGLPSELASHTFDLSDYSIFRGKNVAVIGAGASAIEAGALVHEAGGQAQILVREDRVIWHGRIDPRRSLYERLRKPISVLGPGKKNRFLEEVPLALYFVPEQRRVRFVRGYLGAAAPWWIVDRVQGLVRIAERTTVVRAERAGHGVRLTVRGPDGERTIDVDCVIAGTGYVPDVDRLPYLDDDLRRRIQRLERGPALSMNFESSVRGAYFLGPITAMTFGPLFRFVCGAKYSAPALATHLAGPVRTIASIFRRWTGGAEPTPQHAPDPESPSVDGVRPSPGAVATDDAAPASVQSTIN
jgi:thioredoxin reductase